MGFGGTERWPADQVLTHDHQALLVARVIQDRCKERVHLVGHSYGGATAVRLILRNRELVRTAVLIEPILTPLLQLAGEEALSRVLRHGSGFPGECHRGSLDEAWRAFLDYRNGPGTWQALLEPSRERFRAMTESTVAGFRSNLSNPTSLKDLEQLSLPTLVMCGEKTTVPDRRLTEILRDHIPQCRYEVIPGAEHMSPLSHPAIIAEAVERHINAHAVHR